MYPCPVPLYIVRWPSLCASLINAVDEEDLVDRLAEVGDPDGCRWEQYLGPLWVDLELPVQLDHPSDESVPDGETVELAITGLERVDGGGEPCYAASLGGEESCSDTVEAVTRWAFPSVAALYRTTPEQQSPSLSALEAALRAELTIKEG